MFRRFGTLISSVSLLLMLALAAPSGAFASTAIQISGNGFTACASRMVGDTVCFSEDLNGNGDEHLIFQGFTHNGGIANLNGYRVTAGDGICNGGGLVQNDWNDCITSMWIKVNRDKLCFYHDSNFTGSSIQFYNSGYAEYTVNDLRQINFNDEISSFRWRYVTEAC